MADIKISELTQVSALNNGDLVEVSQVNALAPSGYTSLKASMADIGKKVNTDIEYTTDLADFTDKTTLGAIKETAKGKNIADEYDDTQTYDKGDVVIYKNTLYICTTNNTTGTWDPSKWTATTIDNVIGSLSTLTTTEKSSIVGAVNEVDSNKANASDVYTKSQIDLISNATIAPTAGNGNVYYKIIGNLVIVFGLINTTSGMSTGQDVITGLPRNMNGANNVIKAINNDGTSADWVLYQTNGGTSMKTSIVHTGAKSYTISFAYYTS